MPTLAQAAASPVSSLIDVNFILINRIVVLAVTLLFFTAVMLVRRRRGQDIDSRITTPIKLSLLGFLLLSGEMALSDMPSYRALLEGIQTVVVLLCLAKLAIYLIVDIYLRLHTQAEVPSFLRDAVRLVVYLAAAMISLRLVFKIDVSAIVTTTTVITAVIAFAMQSTLTNALSGFSIQTDKLLSRQNWISVKEKGLFGEIVNVGFRYTTLRSLDSTLEMVPNSVIMQSVVTFHGNRENADKPSTALDVMLDYDTPPERAKELLRRVLLDEPEVLDIPEPLVRLHAFSDSGITYHLRFWVGDPARKFIVQDAIYSQVWYAVNREGSSFPFPHRQVITAEAKPPFVFSRDHIAAEFRQSELFTILDEATIVSLAEHVPVRVFGPGEVVVRQGNSGSSLFIVLKGELDVVVDGATVGSICEDSFFGEMSLLTGEPRRATVRASREVWLAEVTKELMEPLLHANPAVLEKLSSILADREQDTSSRVTGRKGRASATPLREDYLQKLKQFFGM
jgi:small-conductance mechanosensitive channel/CRP-like cAMP-binding protein